MRTEQECCNDGGQRQYGQLLSSVRGPQEQLKGGDVKWEGLRTEKGTDDSPSAEQQKERGVVEQLPWVEVEVRRGWDTMNTSPSPQGHHTSGHAPVLQPQLAE